MNNNKQNSFETEFIHDPRPGIIIRPGTLFALILINLIVVGFLGYQTWQKFFGGSPEITANTPLPTASPTPNITSTAFPTIQTITPDVIVITATPAPDKPTILPGMFVLSLSEGGHFHVFAYHPETQPLTRLTFGEWDDIQPALSPDGSKIAFASHRSGQWDIYVLDLSTGETAQVTNDKAYDGAPSWSPESDWVAFEKFVDNNLDIYIAPVDLSYAPLRVTYDPAPDYEPSWGPKDGLVAFTSPRDGAKDIWLVDIDHIGDPSHISNVTQNKTIDQYHPSWSPNGDSLAWIAPYAGYESIYVADPNVGGSSARYVGLGSEIAWDTTGQYILTIQHTLDQTLLAAYNHKTNTYVLPPFSLSGQIYGISWSNNTIATLPEPLLEIASVTPDAPWELRLTPSVGTIYGRQYVIDVPDVKAPHPALNALAIEPFFALRDRVISETGWDVLSDLENMFVPLTQPLPPQRGNDWLYTGRAFALNPILIDMGWMKVVKEEIGSQTFWRVYIRTREQDGSQGKPMVDFPWDFDARFTGSTTYYEAGGKTEEEFPAGYWVDFTLLAGAYGWERQAALFNWRTFYQGTRFNIFAITSGLDWEDAMLQIYPPEIFITHPAPTP